MKKIIILIMTLLLALCLMSGCGDTSTGEKPDIEFDMDEYLEIAHTKFSVTYKNMDGAYYHYNDDWSLRDNPETYTPWEGEITLNTPYKTGYIFKGWFADSELTDERTTIDAYYDRDLTLYASWEPATFTVYFKAKNKTLASYEYTVNDMTLNFPELEEAVGYTVKWPDGAKLSNTGDTYIYAIYTPINYNINYENVGMATNENPPSYTVEGMELVEPGREGYEFLGWHYNGGKISEIPEGLTGDISIRAEWKAIDYTVSYQNTKGADVSSFATSYTVESDTFSIPEISVPHYTFDGWCDENGEVVTEIAKGSSGSRVLTARLIPIQYKVQYTGMGVSSVENPTMYHMDMFSSGLGGIQLKIPHVKGYDFLGWYDQNGNQVTKLPPSNVGDLVLDASWEISRYSITYYNTKSADMSAFATEYTCFDNTISLPYINVLGYTFKGWFCNGKKITSIPSGSTGNMVIKAEMEPDKYTLMLESPYGKLENKSVTVDYGDYYTLPVLSCEGKTFLGWYDNTGANGIQYTNEQGYSLNKYSHLSGRMLYARFDSNKCSLTFDTMGGEAIDGMSVDYGTAFDDSIIPQKENAIFAGWYNEKFTSRYTSGSVIKSDTVVYARWLTSTPVSTADELNAIRKNPAGNYHLTNDINLNGIVWSPISTFSGTLDGKGYAVKNFSISRNAPTATDGFISINEGTVQNLTFADFTYNFNNIDNDSETSMSIGVMVGQNKGKIYNCVVKDAAIQVYTETDGSNLEVRFGIFAGWNDGVISGCASYVDAKVKTETYFNESCMTSGAESAWSQVGLLVGMNKGTVNDCTTSGSLIYSNYCEGWKKRKLTQYTRIGGLVGNNAGTVKNSYTTASVKLSPSSHSEYSWTSNYVGGLVGLNQGSISACRSSAQINAYKDRANYNYVGGLTGENTSKIINCYFDGKIYSNSDGAVGGLVGYNSSTVQSSYSEGTVDTSGCLMVGGFVGNNSAKGSISKCYAAAYVIKGGGTTGFFVGYNTGVMLNCYFMKGSTLCTGGTYRHDTVEYNTVKKVLYSELWSKELLVDKLYWDSDGWIILANEDPILEWELSIDHNYVETVIEPTCTDFGFTIYSCTDCDRYFIMDVLSEHGHDFTQITTVEPTCTERGYNACYCSRCDQTVAMDIVEPLGHTKGSLVKHKDATCTEAGYDVYSCTVCKLSEGFTEAIPPKGHTEVVVPAVEQTCTTPGKTERIYCDVCKAPIKLSKTIEPHFYHPDTTTVLKAPTCTEPGECTRYCVVCEHLEENAVLAPTGHTDLNGDIVCDSCGIIFGEYEDEDIIEISTVDQLAAVSENLSGVYRLTANITLPSKWTPIGTEKKPFTGYFDGAGYTITLSGFSNVEVAGLFGYNDGIIRNVNVKNASLYVTNFNSVFGSIVAYNSGFITGCSISGDVNLTVVTSNSGSAAEVNQLIRSVIFGGLVGSNEIAGRISDCSADVNLKIKLTNTATCTAKKPSLWYEWLDKSYKNTSVESIANLTVGCVVGRNSGDVTECAASGVLQIGDPSGDKAPTAVSEHHYGSALAYNSYHCGDIAGMNDGTVSRCVQKVDTEGYVNNMDIWVTLDDGMFFSEKVRSEVSLTFFIN